MRSFDEFKASLCDSEKKSIENYKDGINSSHIVNPYYKTRYVEAIGERQHVIDKIDEAAVIEAGNLINETIRFIQTIYDYNRVEYFNNFDHLMNRGIEYNTGFLGLEPGDLACFRNNNPYDKNVCDAFRMVANRNLGTNIPMDGEVKRNKEIYDTALLSQDEQEIASSYIKYMDSLRDSGGLKMPNNTYNFLSENMQYQDALKVCSKQIN